MKTGQIIFLNGTSSSGKTTIAELLQGGLDEPHILASIDKFFSMYPIRFTDPKTRADAESFAKIIPKGVAGFHRVITALANSGINVIVDHVLEEGEWLEQCVREWAELDVLFIAVKCPLAVLKKREQARGDRTIGIAEYQFHRVHAQRVYDVEVDTSILSPRACADLVIKALNSPPQESAFKLMLRKLQSDTHENKGNSNDY